MAKFARRSIGSLVLALLLLPALAWGQLAGSVNIRAVGGTPVDGALYDAVNQAFRVVCVASSCTGGGGGSGGVSQVDNSTFTAGTTEFNPIGGVFNDGLSAVTSGRAAAARITDARGLHSNLRNAAGTEVGTSGAPLRIDPTGSTTQPVSGTVGISGTVTVSGTVTANQGGSPWSMRLQDGAGATLATVTAGNALKVDGSGVTQPVSGTFWQATQPVSGTVTIQDGGGSITVDNGGTFAVQAAQSGTWTVQPGNTANTTAWLVDPRGNVAHDAADSGNPVKIGCQARTTSRTAVADADRADVQCDKNGKLVVTMAAPRERVVRSGVITLSSTTETTLIAAGGAGVFRDLTYLKCTNNSATLVRVDLRDATAGTVIDSWALAASGGGFNLPFPIPYPQATANNNWTVQLSASVTDVRCAAAAVENN